MNTLFGIKNCDTVKKAQAWLKQHEVAYSFHDFRSDGLTDAQVRGWHKELGDELLNRRSTTWKQLTDAQKREAEVDPVALILANPTLIKRPLLDTGATRYVGFKPAQYAQLFR
ncbi:Spx/MgsR family RNA polymerase-binding regulatory protein [Simiduia curdlanivorans]|uniref:Spx/MgsR family RNA polymerase-binding regulatory protein n=1 Tax=Simiduia curdlanivorans TaxID=1492769 RepID=A0ABV8UYL2_9GAMM|nr:Spx/MgsR family RNA polymerase-binding regulatory protein [Simiduia curdlanivorans]MDN3640400.1 Spx/MgsR family RNA polymerase-binding regulatory protein [Simiduia curdlanivorans]